MKKVLFLMFLLFLFLGTASVKAQVRIGGNTPPNPAAALDLNAAEGTTTGTKGLALPRVTLGSSTATLDGATANITGMLVYNTGGSLSTGVYYWSGTNWNRVDGATLGGDTIVGNEVTGATVNRGLVRAGSGTSAVPYTLGIAAGGVDSTMIKPAPAPNSILAFVGNQWRTATYELIYVKYHANISSGTVVRDTLDTTKCMNLPIIYPQMSYVSTTNVSFGWTWINNQTQIMSWILGATGSWYIYGYCWRVH